MLERRDCADDDEPADPAYEVSDTVDVRALQAATSMASSLGRQLSALVAALALALALPIGRKLGRWSDHRLRATESFAAGASLAYVIIDLMVELAGVGGEHVHAVLPIGPTYEKSLFAVVLAGAAWWYLVAGWAARRGHVRARYRAFIVPQTVYGVFVGGALALEAEHGGRQLLLLAAPTLLHLSVVESHVQHEFAGEHSGWPRIICAAAPAFGAIAWSVLGLSPSSLFVALALVAGSTAVQIIQTELPSPDRVRAGPFLVGLGVYVALVAARWGFG